MPTTSEQTDFYGAAGAGWDRGTVFHLKEKPKDVTLPLGGSNSSSFMMAQFGEGTIVNQIETPRFLKPSQLDQALCAPGRASWNLRHIFASSAKKVRLVAFKLDRQDVLANLLLL